MRTAVALLAFLPLASSAQNLGPDAPEMSVGYQPNTGFVFTLSNPLGSNNVLETYEEAIFPEETTDDPNWRFQGYVVLQFATPADADDSIGAVVLDPLRARPVMLTDLADEVQEVTWLADPTGPADCQPMNWYLLNSGIASPLYGMMDPYTFEEYDPGTVYCFTALAFGYNPYHIDAECGGPDNLILSRQSPNGALEVACVTGNAVGIADMPLQHVAMGPVPASDVLRISGLPSGVVQARCRNALGAVVYDGNMRDGHVLSVATWPDGPYSLQLSADDGNSIVRPFIVVH